MVKKSNLAISSEKSKKDICFVIIPFGGWIDDYYVAIYSPAIEAAGLEPHRADDLFRPSTIVNDIWLYTKKSKVLLADLSGKNPNVFYELGLAHALAKPVILIAESIEEIPFDLRALRIIIYDKNVPEWGMLLKNKITASIKEVLLAPAEAVLPAFLNIKGSGSTPTVSLEQKEIIEIKQDLDMLRRELHSNEVEPRTERFKIPHIENYMKIPTPSPEDARTLIKAQLNDDVSDEKIMHMLQNSGIPRKWIINEIKIAKKKRNKFRVTKQSAGQKIKEVT